VFRAHGVAAVESRVLVGLAPSSQNHLPWLRSAFVAAVEPRVGGELGKTSAVFLKARTGLPPTG
jgi:hypothetical protein